MPLKALMDTGPWVALLDRSESNHTKTIQWFRSFDGWLYSTEAVLTEVLYLLNFSIKAQTAAMDFVLSTAIEIIPMDLASLKTAKALMRKYADTPMDYADSTLVCLAMETGINNIVTFDRKDFSIYQVSKAKSFAIFP
ncbi:MAG: PIN domain-containing protein [Desulfobacteraceae bacterium]|nr:PIN domain-containing protein [Desulfobacteraceae bacterium]